MSFAKVNAQCRLLWQLTEKSEKQAKAGQSHYYRFTTYYITYIIVSMGITEALNTWGYLICYCLVPPLAALFSFQAAADDNNNAVSTENADAPILC